MSGKWEEYVLCRGTACKHAEGRGPRVWGASSHPVGHNIALEQGSRTLCPQFFTRFWRDLRFQRGGRIYKHKIYPEERDPTRS